MEMTQLALTEKQIFIDAFVHLNQQIGARMRKCDFVSKLVLSAMHHHACHRLYNT